MENHTSAIDELAATPWKTGIPKELGWYWGWRDGMKYAYLVAYCGDDFFDYPWHLGPLKSPALPYQTKSGERVK